MHIRFSHKLCHVSLCFKAHLDFQSTPQLWHSFTPNMSFNVHGGSMKTFPHQLSLIPSPNLLDFKFMQRGAICSATVRVNARGRGCTSVKESVAPLTHFSPLMKVNLRSVPHLSVTPDHCLSSMKVQLSHSLFLPVSTNVATFTVILMLFLNKV